MSEVKITYIGPHASVTVPNPYGHTFTVNRGETVTVEDWVANGHPGEPGTYQGDKGPEPFTGQPPIGSVILEDPIPPLEGLLAQKPNWRKPPNSHPKTRKDKG